MGVGSSQQTAFDALRKTVASIPILWYYNLEEVTIQHDSSQYGFAAPLMQGGQPVVYVSHQPRFGMHKLRSCCHRICLRSFQNIYLWSEACAWRNRLPTTGDDHQEPPQYCTKTTSENAAPITEILPEHQVQERSACILSRHTKSCIIATCPCMCSSPGTSWYQPGYPPCRPTATNSTCISWQPSFNRAPKEYSPGMVRKQI